MTSRRFMGAFAPVFRTGGLAPGRARRLAAPMLAALLALALLPSAWGLCMPAGGFPGSPRAGSAVAGVLAGLGMLGPANRVEAALAGLASGGAPASAAACGGASAASAQAEPASLPAASPERGAGNPFDVVTGRKHEHRIDLVLPAVDSVTAIDTQGRASGVLEHVSADESLLFQFGRFYSSGNEFSLTLGPGWSHSFDTRLARRRLATAPGPGLPAAELQLVQADGRRITMRPVAALASGRIRFSAADLSDGVVEEDPQAVDTPWVWRWPSGRRLLFDTRGRLAEVVAPDQDRLRLRYDEQGLLASIDDRHGRSVRLMYRGGRLAELVLPDGQSIRYAYNAARQLIGVRYPDGRLVQHQYEDARQPAWLTGTTEPDGRRSRFRYHADGRVAASVADTGDPGSEVRARYRLDDAAGHAGETLLEYQGGTTRYHWRIDAAGAPAITAASGPGCPSCPAVAQGAVRDARGRPTALGDWRLGYDALGRLTSLARGSAAADPVWRLSYPDADPLARPSVVDAPSVVAGARRRIEFTYNARGQLVRLIEFGWAPYSDGARRVARGFQVTHEETGAWAGKRVAVEQLGVSAHSAPDRPAGVAAPAPVVLARTEFRFDLLRRLEAVVYPESVTRRIERDALGRPVREILPDGIAITRHFAPGWQLARLERGAHAWVWQRNREGQLEAIAVDAGDPIRIDSQTAENLVSAYSQIAGRSERVADATQSTAPAPGASLPALIPQGLIVADTTLIQIDADGRRTETVLDDLGRIIEERSAQRGLRQVFHDALGHPVKLVLPAGGLERRRFDAAGRLLEREQSALGASTTTRFHWTGLRLSGLDHPEHAVRATHDQAGRLIRLEHRLGSQAYHYDFKYDGASKLSERSLADGLRLRYEYDAKGRPNRLGLLVPGRTEPVWLVDEVVYRADAAVSERLGAGILLARRFDAEGRLVALDWQRERGRESLARFELRYRNDGLLDSIRRAEGEERFGFDVMGRLIVREWQPTTGATLRSFYHYSPGGDLARMRDESGRSERLEPTGVDAAGRPLTHGAWSLGYGPSGRIERLDRRVPAPTLESSGREPRPGARSEGPGRSGGAASLSPAQAVELRFNGFGERVLRRTHRAGEAPEETRFLYHQNALVAELDGAGRITRHFIRWQGRVIAIVEPERTLPGARVRAAGRPAIVWLLGDHLGTPQVAVDQTGRPVWQARLGPYGEVLESSGAFDQPIRFAGQYHDRDTGLHDNYQRTYDPRRGRYLEPDPLGLAAGWNLHAYAGGNPVQATDPLGLILFAFDGTGNSDPARSPDTLSNVAKFVSLYAGSDRHYMSGVGTFDRGSGIGADAFDTLQATSARRRVDHMLGVLDTALRAPETRGAPVNIDVIGFSRGAAMARDFANTVAARISGGHYLATGRCVSLNFVGLWDTVAQFGLNGQANRQWNLGIPPQARVVVHAVALNEHRRFFPLESIGPAAASAPPGGWRLERGFIGDHGDIGGSHAQGDLSDVALGWMVDQARKAGVGLKALDAAWQTVTDPLLHDARSLLAPGPDREFRLPARASGSGAARSRPGSEAGAAATRGAAVESGSGLDRSRAEAMIRRYPYLLRGHDGAATLAGRVDMAAYSSWLAEHYGLDVQY